MGTKPGTTRHFESTHRLAADVHEWLKAKNADVGTAKLAMLLHCSEYTIDKLLDLGATARARDRIEAACRVLMGPPQLRKVGT